MVENLKQRGIFDKNVLEAMEVVPRHVFLGDSALDEHIYSEKALPILAGQTISNPYTVAFQSQLLDVRKGDKVLEIGTGSGYQTAVLCQMGAKVFSIERQKALFDHTKYVMSLFPYTPKLFFGDGFKGQPAYAPYDRVIITCGAPFVPEELISQLAPGGSMVIPVGEGDQEMILIMKKSDGSLVSESFGKFKFVPMLEEKERSEGKIFFRKS